MAMTDDFVYNNEDETAMGQLHAIHLNLNAVAEVRRELARQMMGLSLSHCADCGEEIPQQRRRAVNGVRLCISCQEAAENS